MDVNNFPESPFEPWHPVSPDNFKGRKEDIVKILRYMPKIIKQGIPEHFFITGKRGMGKTSFVKYVGNKIEEEFHMLPIHLNNEGKDEINDLIQLILESIFKELDKSKKGKKNYWEISGKHQWNQTPRHWNITGKQTRFCKGHQKQLHIFFA